MEPLDRLREWSSESECRSYDATKCGLFWNVKLWEEVEIPGDGPYAVYDGYELVGHGESTRKSDAINKALDMWREANTTEVRHD